LCIEKRAGALRIDAPGKLVDGFHLWATLVEKAGRGDEKSLFCLLLNRMRRRGFVGTLPLFLERAQSFRLLT
jgi:hypothetical protein